MIQRIEDIEKLIGDKKKQEEDNLNILGEIEIVEEALAKKQMEVTEEVYNDSQYSNQNKRDIAIKKLLSNDMEYEAIRKEKKGKHITLKKGEIQVDFLKRLIRLGTAYISSLKQELERN